jgi:hypothetical protein
MDQLPRGWPKIPTRLVIMDAVGIILAGFGLVGLLTKLSGPLAFLADKNVAGVIAAVGFALITFAVGNMLRWFKRVRAQHEPDGRSKT